MDQAEYSSVIQELKTAVAAGDVQAMKWLGDMYYQGQSGDEHNAAAAFPYWKMAADNGDDEMAFKVGLCLQTGTGCSQDDEAAFRYLVKSADAGNVEAQYRVGLCFYHGIGTPEDKVSGGSYLKLAALQNHENAKAALGEEENTSSDGGGCYIATAIYGSYDAPEVRVLRGFRDNTLKQHWWGRLFIRTYYLLSPPFAQKLKNASKVNAFVRQRLDKIVQCIERTNSLE